MTMPIEITVFDRNAAITRCFEGTLVKTITTDDIRSLEGDAIVSPANSFGFMDGGIDLAYLKAFGFTLQDQVRAAIEGYTEDGELLVGEAIPVLIPGARVKYLIVAPTMRVPKLITDYADVMLAARAALRCALNNGFKSIFVPGMGTGCGNVPPLIAAHAMIEGFEQALNPPQIPKTIVEAANKHYAIGKPKV